VDSGGREGGFWQSSSRRVHSNLNHSDPTSFDVVSTCVRVGSDLRRLAFNRQLHEGIIPFILVADKIRELG
jgi:hypothetical protein